MAAKHKIIDADFEVVGGPHRVGDEHPTQKGWYFTDKVDRSGNPLWYKPPGPVSRWTRRIALFLFVAMMAVAVIGSFFGGSKTDPDETRRILEVTDPNRPQAPTEPPADAAVPHNFPSP